MTHEEHVHLIKKAITTKGGTWADFGSGDGAFTLALADLAGPEVSIFSLDKDKSRLETQEKAFETMFPQAHIRFLATDFTMHVELPPLDGIVMANSLHYVEEQVVFLTKIRDYLKPDGKLVLVEYNTQEGNQWVPYPVSFIKFEQLAEQSGFIDSELLEKIPSTFSNEMYCAQAIAPSLFSSRYFRS
jgi:ubiquinone/menaquinone biosynthesis C-methylase UbiE